VIVAAATLCLLWGTTWGAIKIGVSEIPAFEFALARAVLATGILVAVSLAFRQRFPRDRRTLAAIAFAGAVNIGLSWVILFWAEQFVPSGLAAIFGASATIWTAVFAHFFVHDDRLSRRKVVALGLGVAGVALLVRSEGAETDLLAAALLAAMPVLWAIAAVVSRLQLRAVPALPMTALQTGVGALVIAPFALADLGKPARWDVASVSALAYLVLFGTCIGFAIFVWLLQRLRPTTVLLFQVVYPAEAVLIGALFLNEPVTPPLLIGFGLVALAVLLNAFSPARPVLDVPTTTA
jgi:drug/metabolite transporter (DMT)-like permease